MAKIYKKAIISTEEFFLNRPVEEEIPEQECSQPLVDESQVKEAYEQGYLQGQTEERTRIEQELEQLQQHLQSTLASIPDAIAQNRLNLNQEIADIVLLIAQQFFIEQQQDHKALSQQINQILTQLNSKETIELYLHPQEISALQNGSIQLDAAHLNGLKIKNDEALALGGCRIKTSHGVFDASIEKQIDKLKSVLLKIKQGGADASLD